MDAPESARAWKQFVHNKRIIPPAFDRQKKVKESPSPFCLGIKSIDGLPSKSQGGNHFGYQVKVHLFDITYKCFYGRSWQGPLRSASASTEGKVKVAYNQSAYFYTCTGDSSVVAIVEVESVSEVAGKSVSRTVGWGILRVFSGDTEGLPDVTSSRLPASKRLDLYHGSPRALYQLEDPIEKHPLMTVVSGCVINYQLLTHYSLLKISHLLPENVIVGVGDVVPGLGSISPTKGNFLTKLKPLDSFVAYLDNVTITMLPNFDKFEDNLCRLLDEDRLNRDNRIAEGMSVSIQERRLQIGVHNGYGYVDRPEILQLVPQEISQRRGSSMRKVGTIGSTLSMDSGGNIGMSLMLRERVPLHGVIDDALCALVFSLEYIIQEPMDVESRKQSMMMGRLQTFSVMIRWCAWTPFPGPHLKPHPIKVSLIGGSSPGVHNPNDLLVYKALSDDFEQQNGVISFSYVEVRSPNQYPNDEGGLSPAVYGMNTGSYYGQSNQFMDTYEDSVIQPMASPNKPPRNQRSIRYDDTASPHGANRGAKGDTGRSSQLQFQQQHQNELFNSHEIGYDDAGYPSQPRNVFGQHQSLPNLAPSVAGIPGGMSAPNLYPGAVAMEMNEAQDEPVRASTPKVQGTPKKQEPHAETRLQPSYTEEFRDTVAYHSHAPITRQSSSQQPGLTRAAYARLYSIKFPPILDRHQEAPEVINPEQPLHFNLQREEMDVLQCNEIIFQFIAFSREYAMNPLGPVAHHATVFFTFQFYRYPQVTTERMLLSNPEKSLSPGETSQPCILYKLNGDGSPATTPGFTVRYLVDPTQMKPGEAKLFVQHLVQQRLHIDVWDGDSLLCIGTASVSLKDMCRQGREAIQMTFELPVHKMTSNIERRENVAGPYGKLPPKGVLHLRLANVGHPIDHKALKSSNVQNRTSTSNLVASAKSSQGSFFGGSLVSGLSQAVKESKSSRALHMSSVDRELAAALSSAPHLPPTQLTDDGDEARKRKVARMEAIRAEEENTKPAKTYMNYKTEKQARVKDLKIIEVYREKTKRDGILNILHKSITIEHTIFPSMGSTEFFECPLKNPHNHLVELGIHISDPELSVITNAMEWRHFKQLKMVQTPCEEDMFVVDPKGFVKINLQPKESVNIPLKFYSLKADHSVIPQEPGSEKVNQLEVTEAARSLSESLATRVVDVTFKVCETDQLISILSVHIHPQPHIISETYRYTHTENTFFGHTFRLPSSISLPNYPIGGGAKSKIHVACSDPNVILGIDSTSSSGEPQSLRLKTAVGVSPSVKRFFVCIYQDPFLAQPLEIWQFFFHSLQRVDISAPEGETTSFHLIVKGTQASRFVQCFTSHPFEMSLTPNDSFLLSPNAVHELEVKVKSSHVGRRAMYINVVDIDYHQLVRTWMISYDCQQAEVRKSIKVKVPIEGGVGSNKRVSYTNPYRTAKSFFISTNLPNFILVKTDRLDLSPNQTGVIMFTVLPQNTASLQTGALLYINDENDQNQETLGIMVSYGSEDNRGPLNMM